MRWSVLPYDYAAAHPLRWPDQRRLPWLPPCVTLEWIRGKGSLSRRSTNPITPALHRDEGSGKSCASILCATIDGHCLYIQTHTMLLLLLLRRRLAN